MIDTILFDLDGTLLPMNQELFIKHYGEALLKKCYPKYGEKSKELIYILLKSINVMYVNDGKVTNEELFWNYFSKKIDIDRGEIEPFLNEFYDNEFKDIVKACNPTLLAKEVVDLLKEKGYKVVLTTNPFFPKKATHNRVKWAGLDPDSFELITVFENSHFCKPNLKYYEEVLNKINKQSCNCLMVGNDVLEDGVVENLGIPCFLITDCLINSKNLNVDTKYNGSFVEFLEFAKNLPNIK